MEHSYEKSFIERERNNLFFSSRELIGRRGKLEMTENNEDRKCGFMIKLIGPPPLTIKEKNNYGIELFFNVIFNFSHIKA